MARLKHISVAGLDFDTGQSISFDGEVFVEVDGKANVISAAAKSIDPRMGDVYLHLDGQGKVDGVRIQNDGKKPSAKWWKPSKDVV